MEPLGSFPRVLNVLPREKIEGPPRDFLKASPRPHPRPDQRPKTRGAAGPEGFFGLRSGLGCGLGFTFRKSLWGPSIFSLGSTLSTLGKLPRGSIHHATSSAFPQIVPNTNTKKNSFSKRVDSGKTLPPLF